MSLIPLLVLINIIFGLVLEAFGAARGWPWAEPLVALVTCAHLVFYFVRLPQFGSFRVNRKMLVSCLILSTVGELILSTAWGLYTYRQTVLPIFVPPGHVLLFLSGLAISHKIETDNRWIWLVPVAAVVITAWSVSQGRDALSAGLLILFAVSFAFKQHRPLYAVMFVLAFLLEILGTYLGSWSWSAAVPHLMISSANPPLAAGALYAVLDLLTIGICGGWAMDPSVLADSSISARDDERDLDSMPG